MQALKLDALAGWRWVAGGWRIFRKQPFAFASLLFFYALLLFGASPLIESFARGVGSVLPPLLADLVALVGGLLVAVVTPALSVGFQQACRLSGSGLPIHPILLLAPFRSGRPTLRRLLVLGVIQAIALVVIVFITIGPSAFRSDPPPVDGKPAASAPAAPVPGAAPGEGGLTAEQQDAIRKQTLALFKQALTFVPVAAIMWYAPMLVAWHGLPPGKAIFFSVVAVWRNRSAFAVYIAGWMSVWMGLSIAFSIVLGLFTLIGIGSLAAIVAIPLLLSMVTCMYCSVYPTYATVFVDPEAPATPVVPPPS